MRLMVLMVVLAGLSGCAGMASQPGNDSELADVRAKIALGRCDEGLVTGLRNQNMPELDQEAAYVCLQRGELEAVEQLLADYSKRHRDPPHPDYSAYLLALTQQLRFELTEDDTARLREGRAAHARYAEFARTYPDSEYRTEVGPRLNTLLDEMASAELRLAQAAANAGDRSTAQARMQYIMRHYPLSGAAREAGNWLEARTGDEDENVPPGTAW